MKYLDKKQETIYKEDEKRTDKIIQAFPMLRDLHKQQRQYEFNISIPETSVLVLTGDWHIGHLNPDEQLEYDLALIRKYNLPTITMGDLFENYNLTSTQKKPSEAMVSLPDQKRVVIKLMNTIKDNVIGMITGNHEMRSYYSDRYNFTYEVCKELGFNYLGRWSRVNMKRKKNILSGFFAHMWKGNSIYNQFHPCVRARIDRPRLAGNVDVVAIAHNHVKGIQRTNGINNIRTGCYVDYDDYGDFLGHLPKSAYNGSVAIAYNDDGYMAFESIQEALAYLNLMNSDGRTLKSLRNILKKNKGKTISYKLEMGV